MDLLSEQERARIEAPTTLADLSSKAKEISDAMGKARKSNSHQRARTFGDWASALKPFDRMLGSACKFAPGGELIWSSVSFIVEMARNNVAVFEEVAGFFESMAQDLALITSLEGAFDHKALIIPAIEALYTSILLFWVKAVEYYYSKLKKRTPKSWFINLISSEGMAEEFKNLESKIAQHKTKLERIASAQHIIDDADDRKQTRRRELVKWISAPSYFDDLARANKSWVAGTCMWMKAKKEYNDLVEGKANILIIYGIPGAGKTVLTAWLINEARPVDQDGIILYHFFKATDDSKNTPLAAVHSLIAQLHNHLVNTQHIALSSLEARLDDVSHSPQVQFEQLWNILSSTISECRQDTTLPAVTIILDAIDECQWAGALIGEFMGIATQSTRIIVTSRASGEHVGHIYNIPDDQRLVLNITSCDSGQDISSFVRHEIESVELLNGEENLRNEIIEKFGDVANHQGMFLWAYLMCKEIHDQLYDDVLMLLDNLPKGLDEMYARICQRLKDRFPIRHLEFGQEILQWLVASTRPLCFAELEPALQAMHHFKSQGHGRRLWTRRTIVDVCGDFIVYSGLNDEDVLRLVHLSAQQFLQSSLADFKKLAVYEEGISSFLVDVARARCSIARTCLYYLTSSALRSHKYTDYSVGSFSPDAYAHSRAAFTKSFPLFSYASIYWLYYVLEILSIIQNHKQADPDCLALLAEMCDFVVLPSSMLWVEECANGLGVEYAFSITRQLSSLPSDLVPREIVRWATKIWQRLELYRETLTRVPQMARICLSSLYGTPVPHSQLVTHLGHTMPEEQTPKPSSQFHSLEPRVVRAWMHYDSTTDRLYSMDARPDVIRLRCQVLSTGRRFRPVQVVTHHQVEYKQPYYEFCSAAISTNGRYIAATYSDFGDYYPDTHTVCWSILSSQQSSSMSSFAEIIFVDQSFDNHLAQRLHRRRLLAFESDRRLYTPCRVWDLQTLEWDDGPVEIYNPDPQERVYATYFSSRSRYVARVLMENESGILMENETGVLLQRLEINGKSLPKHSMPFHTHSEFLIHQLKISPSGEKAALYLYYRSEDSERMPVCFVFEEEKLIKLATPLNSPIVVGQGYNYIENSFQFTADEEKLLASAYITPNLKALAIVIWSFTKECGTYVETAHMKCIFYGYDHYGPLSFCFGPSGLHSGLGDARGHILIAQASDGSFSTASMNKECTLSDTPAPSSPQGSGTMSDLKSGVHQTLAVVDRPGGIDLVFCTLSSSGDPNRPTDSLMIEKWSLDTVVRMPELICRMEGFIASTNSRWPIVKLSGTGQFLVVTLTILSESEDQWAGRKPSSMQLFNISGELIAHGGQRHVSDVTFELSNTMSMEAEILAIAFSDARETRIAALLAMDIPISGGLTGWEQQPWKISILDIEAGRLVPRTDLFIQHSEIASSHRSFYMDFIWSRHDPGLLGLSTSPIYSERAEASPIYVPKVVGNKDITVITSEINYQIMVSELLQFSSCGNYICSCQSFDDWPTMFRLPMNAKNSELDTTIVKHPLLLELHRFYVFTPYVFRLRRARHQETTGIVSLDRALFDPNNGMYYQSEIYQTRIICVIPDTLHVARNHVFIQVRLMWPHNPDGEVSVLVTGWHGAITNIHVISTSMKSHEVMNDEHWHPVTIGSEEGMLYSR